MPWCPKSLQVAPPIRHICPQQAEPRRNVLDRLAGVFLQAGSSPLGRASEGGPQAEGH
jgi:hypothetical protein